MKEASTYTPVFNIEGLRQEMAAVPEGTREVILSCIAEGGLEEPPSRHFTPEGWERNIDITLRYFLSDETVQQLAHRAKISHHQGASNIIYRTLRSFRQKASEEVQKMYHPDTLLPHKNLALMRGKRLAEKITSLQEQGLSPEEILEELGISKQQLRGRRESAQKVGIHVPTLFRRSKSETKAFIQQLRTAEDPAIIQELLHRVDKGFYTNYVQGDNPLFVSLRTLTQDLFYATKTGIDEFVAVLTQSGIPVGVVEGMVGSGKQRGYRQRYHFIAAQHLDLAREALEKAEKLQQYKTSPVRRIAGPDDQPLPVSTKLLQKDAYASVGKLLARFNIHIRGSRTNHTDTDDFLRFCPVPIYRYLSGIYYPVDQEEALIAYIQEQIGDKE